MSQRPNYPPVTQVAAWLSSDDVKAAIIKVAEAGGDKSTCWDLHVAITKLSLTFSLPSE